MSAEKGWIGEPQPEKEWHTPGWLAEKGTGHSHFHSHILPDENSVAALNVLREAAGLEPLPDDDNLPSDHDD